MKNKILAFLGILFLSSCASKKERQSNVEFTIIDQTVKDNAFINLQIVNKTRFDYYLPIINSAKSEKWKYLLSADENKFFFIYKVGYTVANKKVSWYSENCTSEIDTELESLNEEWEKMKRTIKANDLIRLKSGEKIIIQVPMNLNIEVSKDCSWQLENYKNEKGLKIGLHYPEKNLERVSKFLNAETIKDLRKSGYALYGQEINSNAVPLSLNK